MTKFDRETTGTVIDSTLKVWRVRPAVARRDQERNRETHAWESLKIKRATRTAGHRKPGGGRKDKRIMFCGLKVQPPAG